ncbi:MAG: hypothetical protein JXR37_23235 [Kiritimatiellae bacterium]|nr:hypothetical protein [Kiritimatiellia bacterium]
MADRTTQTVKVGFVPSYRSRFTDWCGKMYDRSLAAFGGVTGLEVVRPPEGRTRHGAVSGLDEAETAADHFLAQKIDGLIVCPLDFGDERSVGKIAERLNVPVLLYATKEPPAATDASLARVSDSYCGNLAAATALYRRKTRYHWAGLFFPDEPELRDAVQTFVQAVSVGKGLKGARIGQVGLHPAAFESVAYDEPALIRKFGQNVITKSLAEIVDAARALSDADPQVQAIMERTRASVPVITAAESYLPNAAKLELALTEFWTENRLSAMALQCWPAVHQTLGLEPCAVNGRLVEQGMLTACEADVLGAVSMLISYRSALGRTVPHLIDWTIRHREDENRLLAWHCGNAPLCLANDPRRTAIRSRADMKGELTPEADKARGGLHQFQLKPGPVTLCRLAECDDAWKLLIVKGEIVPSDDVQAGTWSWVQVPDHDRLYRTLVENGFIHHASLIHGDQTQALELACKFLDLEPVLT